MSTELVKTRFFDWEGDEVMDLRLPDGTIWFTAEFVGRKLGYDKATERIRALIGRHKDEISSEFFVILNLRNFTEFLIDHGAPITDGRLKETVKSFEEHEDNQGKKKVLLLERRAVNKVLMFTRQPKGKEFRAWLDKLVDDVQTKGYYIESGEHLATAQALTKVSETLDKIVQRFDDHDRRLSALESTREDSSMAIERERSSRFTATEYAKANFDTPKGFNRGGSYDTWVAMEYYNEFGQFPAQRIALVGRNKMREYVYSKTADSYEWHSKAYRKYMKTRWSRQTTLKLVPPQPNPVEVRNPEDSERLT